MTDPVVSRPDVSTLGYEQARDELAEVVRVLEVGGLGLDESVALWERGEAPAGTRLRVRVADGAVGAVVAGEVETDAP